jgi:hypothetical protein
LPVDQYEELSEGVYQGRDTSHAENGRNTKRRRSTSTYGQSYNSRKQHNLKKRLKWIDRYVSQGLGKTKVEILRTERRLYNGLQRYNLLPMVPTTQKDPLLANVQTVLYRMVDMTTNGTSPTWQQQPL